MLDISGSMGSSFDGTGEQQSKLEVAKQSLLTLLARLTPKDRFGLVIFDTVSPTYCQVYLFTWSTSLLKLFKTLSF